MKSSSSSKKKKIEDIVSTISEFLPTETVSFIESQLNCADKKPKGRRWTFKDKSVALSIYFHSKRAYKVLGKIFKLPSKSTLSKILQGSGISPGISDKVMHALKIKANQMSIEDRQCVLLFDEMSLKYGLTYNPHGDFIEGFENYGNFGSTQHISNHALCFMVRGLKQKWKQPLAYFLSSNTTPSQTLKCITKSIITQLTDINLNVRVLICDQGSSNRSFLETNEHVNSTQPYFYVNNQKIFVMYDPPHLLKSIRNNLCSTGFLLDGKQILWKYVGLLYDLDCKSTLRIVPKLTKQHVQLTNFSKMRVNLAAQVLSHSVAAGIEFCVNHGLIDSNAIHTANFISLMDRLFNVFNSCTLFSSVPYKSAISSHTSHLNFLNECIETFKKLRILTGKTVPSINGWLITINSLILLWKDLNETCNYKFLLTNRLNQDCLENLFSVIRGKGGHRDNPTPCQFRTAFRQIVFDSLLEKSAMSNCKLDVDRVLLDISSFHTTTVKSSQNLSQVPPIVMDKMPSIDVLHLPTTISINACCYVAGYLLYKLKISCELCRQKLILNSIPANDSRYSFYITKQYKEFGKLMYPSQKLINFVDNLNRYVSFNFPQCKYMQNIVTRLINGALAVLTDSPYLYCNSPSCYERFKMLIRLFFRVKIFHTLKCSSIESVGEDKTKKRKNRKVLKIMNL